ILLIFYVIIETEIAEFIASRVLHKITVIIIILCTYVKLQNINLILFISITLNIIQFNLTLLYIIYMTLLLQSKPFVISNETWLCKLYISVKCFYIYIFNIKITM